jgi:hypothetical protein
MAKTRFPQLPDSFLSVTSAPVSAPGTGTARHEQGGSGYSGLFGSSAVRTCEDLHDQGDMAPLVRPARRSEHLIPPCVSLRCVRPPPVEDAQSPLKGLRRIRCLPARGIVRHIPWHPTTTVRPSNPEWRAGTAGTHRGWSCRRSWPP